MKPPIRLRVGAKLFPLCIHLARVFEVGLQALGVVVGVDEVVAGVVRQVDVDHLDLAQVGLLQELEHLQVVALDDEIFRGVEIDAILAAGEERPEARGLDDLETVGLARPVHAVALFAHIDHFTQSEFQALKVNLAALGADLRKEPQEFLLLVLGDVVGA